MGREHGKGRILWLDIARTLAVILISLNHAVNRAYSVYENQSAEFYSIPFSSTLFKTIFLVCSHVGVPLFLMITGALILNKSFCSENDIRKFYRNNFLSLLITTEIWYFIMYWGIAVFYEHSVRGNLVGSLIGCLKTMMFIDQVTMGSMWYMPVILCLYLILPFVSVLVKRFPIRTFAIPAAIVFLSGMVMPFVNAMSTLFGGQEVVFALETGNLFSFYLLYILAGYWIFGGLLKHLKTSTLIVGGLSFVAITCIIQLLAFRAPGNYVATYDFPLYLLIASCLFELLRRYGSRDRTSNRVNIYIYQREPLHSILSTSVL